MQIISGSISASTAPSRATPLASMPCRVVVLLLRFTLLRTFPRDDPLCVLLATENAALTTMTTTMSAPPDSPSFYFIFVLSLPLPLRCFPSDVFHCHPLFRLLLLTSFVRTSLQRKKGEKECARGTTRE